MTPTLGVGPLPKFVEQPHNTHAYAGVAFVTNNKEQAQRTWKRRDNRRE